jgi:hypothetical protein
VEQEAEYYERLADRYEALAATMTAAMGRETIASLASQFRERAAEAGRLKGGAEQLQQDLPRHLSIRFQP